ncbi:sensor histidine kinase [Alicyclobacillus acidocaldarius]|uniref:histidine kinase n=1 Tax=Alicyclobacillus acidocaldarius (strain Tc-4-1) TaxID=1048834 RepID=F8IHS3_ALIAT|nr:HAMP domain-containing sensor histidine kinase [Alicyclobacillus acidocaldarius]AEJ42040.1 histidine kinase [Alicyclobacillus acidocaldarius subsp. acidocaldarius Tc-4-1]
MKERAASRGYDDFRARHVRWQWREALDRLIWMSCWSFILLSASYGVVRLIGRAFGWRPVPYGQLMMIGGVGVVMLALVALLWNALGFDRDDRLFFRILDSLREIGRGNFSARAMLEVRRGFPDHPMNQLVLHVREMAEGLERIEQMRQEFVANVSHEMQTPLTSILGFVKALKSEGLSEGERRHYLDIIEAESERLSRLADNLLKLTSLESGHHPVTLKRFRLDRQLREVAIACEPLWTEKGLLLDMQVEPVELEGDEDLLGQVWMNLLSNAIKFTEPGGRIQVRLEKEDTGVCALVADTGIGIRPEDMSRVFTRFFKADRSRGKPGNGLGLAIAKRIVEMHHGDISVESEPGRGSTFKVHLPYTQGGR